MKLTEDNFDEITPIQNHLDVMKRRTKTHKDTDNF
jgi:hypothetical protein